MDNSDKIILDLCGGTGSWSQPYADAGYDVRIITLPENDVFLYNDYKNFIDKVHGILSAPTCTHFSFARTTAKTERNLNTAMALVRRCRDIIEDCRLNGNLKFWAMENPVGYLRHIIGKPPLTFHPYEYAGHLKDSSKEGYTKRTDIWGFYNMPKKKPVELTEQQARECSINNRTLPEIPIGYKMPCNMSRQAVRRSITSKGFAKAFYKANK